MYGNEKEVGEAVRASGIDRERRLRHQQAQQQLPRVRRRAAAPSTRRSKDLDLGYLDLFLVHWPLPTVGDFVETWKAMEEIYAGGRVRAIGVSNFQPTHLRRIHGETNVTPAVNQIEVHPYLANDEVRAFDAEHGIATEAWSPIAQGKVLDDPTIVRIAENLGKTPGPGDPALAPAARRHRLPEVGDPRARGGELRRCSTSSSPAPTWTDITALDRGRAHRARPGHVQLRPELIRVG